MTKLSHAIRIKRFNGSYALEVFRGRTDIHRPTGIVLATRNAKAKGKLASSFWYWCCSVMFPSVFPCFTSNSPHALFPWKWLGHVPSMFSQAFTEKRCSGTLKKLNPQQGTPGASPKHLRLYTDHVDWWPIPPVKMVELGVRYCSTNTI